MFFFKKKKFIFNNIFLNNKVTFKQATLNINKKKNKMLNLLYFILNNFNLKINQLLSLNFFFFLLKNFFLTHDLFFFSQKLSFIFYNASKPQLLKFIRNFLILNNKYYEHLFNFFKISGMYIKISGKFNGFGGAKKLKKHIILHKIKFNDKNIKIKRSINFIRHKVGLTTWSAFASFLKCLILI